MMKAKRADQLYSEGQEANQLYAEGHYVYALFMYCGIWYFGELTKPRAYPVEHKCFSGTSVIRKKGKVRLYIHAFIIMFPHNVINTLM